MTKSDLFAIAVDKTAVMDIRYAAARELQRLREPAVIVEDVSWILRKTAMRRKRKRKAVRV